MGLDPVLFYTVRRLTVTALGHNSGGQVSVVTAYRRLSYRDCYAPLKLTGWLD